MKIRKITLAIFLFSLCTFQAAAQFSIGLRGGVHLGDLKISNASGFGSNPQSRAGALVGIVSEYRFNNNIAIQPELNFLQKGSRQEFSLNDSLFGNISAKAEIILNYLELPLLVKVGGDLSSILRIDALAGPGIGYALDGTLKSVTSVNGETEREEEPIEFDELSRTDFSVHLGAMLTLRAGARAQVFVDGRYIIGLTNLNTSGEEEEVRNRGGSFSAGVLFGL